MPTFANNETDGHEPRRAAEAEAAASVAPLPTAIGGFSIRRKIGEGGMGVVFEAEQREPRRLVALKVMRGGPAVSEGQLRLFQREIRTLAHLRHDGIAALYQSGSTPDGQYYFAMELVHGSTLSDYIARTRGEHGPSAARLREWLLLFCRICGAVQYAHQRGVIHRDLKPANILVGHEECKPGTGCTDTSNTVSVQPVPRLHYSDPVPRVKVLDFGLARITDADLALTHSVTDFGAARGTLQYMSPEQLQGEADEIDARSDIYSLGVVLYEILTGQSPYEFERAAPHELARVILVDPPRAISRAWSARTRLDPDLVTIVMKALEKEPARRYASAAALAEDIERYLAGQPILARPPRTLYQLRKLIARNRWPFASLGAIALILVATTVGMAVLASHLASERDRANREARRATEQAAAAERAAELSHALLIGTMQGNNATVVGALKNVITGNLDALEHDMSDRPLVLADMLVTATGVFQAGGDHARALTVIDRAIALTERNDPTNAAAWRMKCTRAELLAALGRLREAAASLAPVRAEVEARSGPASIELAYVLEELGCFERDLGHLAEAKALLGRAREIYLAAPSPQANLVTSIHDSLGNLYLTVGDNRAAEQEHRLGLAMAERFTPGGVWDGRARLGVGLSLLRQGHVAEAAPLIQSAFDIVTGRYGATNVGTWRHFVGRAELRSAQGRLEDAERDLTAAIDLIEQSVGARHPWLITPLEQLARVRRKQGLDASVPLERAKAIRESL